MVIPTLKPLPCLTSFIVHTQLNHLSKLCTSKKNFSHQYGLISSIYNSTRSYSLSKTGETHSNENGSISAQCKSKRSTEIFLDWGSIGLVKKSKVNREVQKTFSPVPRSYANSKLSNIPAEERDIKRHICVGNFSSTWYQPTSL